jgi:hypothetical protein
MAELTGVLENVKTSVKPRDSICLNQVNQFDRDDERE